MTATQIRPQRHFKTNPDCPSSRHVPNLESYRRGCRCPQTLAFRDRWAQERADPNCPAVRHTPTDNSWKHCCRCAGAIIAHEERKLSIRRDRAAALAVFDQTGKCGAVVHGSVGAYRRGCRCPGVAEMYSQKHTMEAKRARDHFGTHPINLWREGRMRVDRTNLFLLVHGFVDRPTTGELIAAFAILSQRGSEVTGWLTDQEIATRIGAARDTVYRCRQRIAELRATRAERRLADVRGKAKRVAAAPERRSAVVAEQAAGRERTARRRAEWKRHCRTMRRLRESQARARSDASA